MKMPRILALTFIFIFSSAFFQDCDGDDPEPVLGCTDSRALNRSFAAEQDDGSCQYSRASFYASASAFNGIAITRIDLALAGNVIGSTDGTFYPNGPGNCSAPGTIFHQFENGDRLDWNATITLATGATIITTGQVVPSSIECIRVNITR